MKSITIKAIIQSAGFSLLLLFFASCGDQKDTFKDFATSETNYLAKPDTVFGKPGKGKVQINIALKADARVKGGTLKSFNEEINHEFEVNRKKPGKDTLRFDLAISEGTYSMNLVLLGDDGIQSLPVEFSVSTLGKKYAQLLLNRSVSRVKFDSVSQEALILWGIMLPNMTSTQITYRDANGARQKVEVTNTDRTTRVSGFLPNSDFQVLSTYQPPQSISTFTPTAVSTYKLPKCNKKAELTLSESTIAFGDVERGQTPVRSFTVGLAARGCLSSDVTLFVPRTDRDKFKISTTQASNFDDYKGFLTLSVAEVMQGKTIYVRCNAASTRNGPLKTPPPPEVPDPYIGFINLREGNLVRTRTERTNVALSANVICRTAPEVTIVTTPASSPASSPALQLTQVGIKSFTIQSTCPTDRAALTLASSTHFDIAQTATGPFGASVTDLNISTTKTIYVLLKTITGITNTTINIVPRSQATPITVSLSGP